MMLREFVLEALSRIRWNIIGRNPLMVIPLLSNQDLTPMLYLQLLNHGLSSLPHKCNEFVSP